MPGNHEGDCAQVSRAELLQLVGGLPGCCIPPSAATFDYALRVALEGCPERTVL